MNVIEMSQVSKRYGSVTALSSLDLQVKAGEIVGFLGPNGAGKSTAIGIMLGLRKPSKGTVRLLGLPPTSRSARTRVGVMLQESGVPDNLTVEEVIRLFQSYYPYTLPTAEILKRADLASKRTALVSALSGGQKQRLYFALAITGDPDVLFLDEPTVAMDVTARQQFWEQVKGFADLGKTVLFSTHYLEEADAIASRIIVIHQGQVMATGSPAEIKQLVAAKTLRFKTSVPVETLSQYPDVEHVERQNGEVMLLTNAAEAVLEKLFQDKIPVSHLTVTETDLESAFITLTKEAQA